jgi:hypothetical protein
MRCPAPRRQRRPIGAQSANMDAYLAGKDHDDDGESDLIAQIL